MKIKDTLKAWSDAEINLVTKDSSAFDYNDRWIIRWYFFGSCDMCSNTDFILISFTVSDKKG